MSTVLSEPVKAARALWVDRQINIFLPLLTRLKSRRSWYIASLFYVCAGAMPLPGCISQWFFIESPPLKTGSSNCFRSLNISTDKALAELI